MCIDIVSILLEIIRKYIAMKQILLLLLFAFHDDYVVLFITTTKKHRQTNGQIYKIEIRFVYFYSSLM